MRLTVIKRLIFFATRTSLTAHPIRQAFLKIFALCLRGTLRPLSSRILGTDLLQAMARCAGFFPHCADVLKRSRSPEPLRSRESLEQHSLNEKSRFSASRIVGILKEVGPDARLNATCGNHDIGEPTYCKWQSQFSGMTVSHRFLLRPLQDDNAQLKRMYADLALMRSRMSLTESADPGAWQDGRSSAHRRTWLWRTTSLPSPQRCLLHVALPACGTR